VEATLSRLVRLSYWDRIQKVLPPSFHGLLPPKPEPQVGPARAVLAQTPICAAHRSACVGLARAHAHTVSLCLVRRAVHPRMQAVLLGFLGRASLDGVRCWRPWLHWTKLCCVLRCAFPHSRLLCSFLFFQAMQRPGGTAGAGAAAAPSREWPGEWRPERRRACGGGDGAGRRDARGARSPGHGVPICCSAHTPGACTQTVSRRAC